MIIDCLLDALIDSLKCVPFLLLAYIAIEFIEERWGHSMGSAVAKAGAAGPAIGALVGSVPQCGFSVMGTALYTQRMVTIGTLLAVYLSTSDEAIPVILSHPDQAAVLFPVLLFKIVIALLFGYLIDFIFRKRNEATLAHLASIAEHTDHEDHDHEHVLEEKACCGHTPGAEHKALNWKHLLVHPLIHTLKVFLFIFVVAFILNVCIESLGSEHLGELFEGLGFFQIILACLIGLIPNCAASVAITELFLEGVIGFGPLIAGLCASGGVGILLLFKESERKRDAFFVIALLLLCSIAAGLCASFFA